MKIAQQILERWPLRSMLARCGIDAPSRGKFPSPFRPDKNPSCEIWKETIRDRSSGETFDSIRVFAERHGIDNGEAIRRLAAELPGAKQPRAEKPRTLEIPPLPWNRALSNAVCELRGLRPQAGEMAGRYLGTLGFGNIAGFQSWALFERGRLAEGRRVDGELYPAIGKLGARKSHTLRGSCKAWPLGINPPAVEIPPTMRAVVVEGMPDYLAACDMLAAAARDFVPVAMLGASQGIHADALPWFRGREVLVLGHPDQAGLDSAKRWTRQLQSAGASVRAVQLDGGDLNDIVTRAGAREVAKGFQL
jgi:hypothetical protein